MNDLQIKIEKLSSELQNLLQSLICDSGKVFVSSYGNRFPFKTMEDAELFAKHTFINEDEYGIYDDTYTLSE